MSQQEFPANSFVLADGTWLLLPHVAPAIGAMLRVASQVSPGVFQLEWSAIGSNGIGSMVVGSSFIVAASVGIGSRVIGSSFVVG